MVYDDADSESALYARLENRLILTGDYDTF